MFNIGFSELLILAVIALIFIGPQQLPEVARTIGRLLNEWKRATSDLQSSLTTTLTEDLKPRKDIHQEQIASPTDQDVALRVEQETPETAKLPEGAAPVTGDHGDKK